MKLIFDSLAEARDFLDEIADDGDGTDTAAVGGTRRKRRTKAQMEADKAIGVSANQQAFQAPPPNQPAPATAAPPVTGFAAPAGQQGFPPAAPPQNFTPAPANPLVQAIIDRTNDIVAGRNVPAAQPLDQCVGWLRSVLGPEAAQANWEQICAAFLPKAPEATLKHIAGAIGVPA